MSSPPSSSEASSFELLDEKVQRWIYKQQWRELHGIQQRLNPRLVAHKLRAYSSRVPRIDELSAHIPARQMRSPRISA